MKVKVRDKKEFGRHFCSEVHAVDVTVKAKLQIVYTEKHLAVRNNFFIFNFKNGDKFFF